MDDRKRQGKSSENVGLVSKVEPLKPISCGHCGKPGHIITNCWKLGGKTPCEHCGRFNHKSEDCRIAKNKLQKEVKPTGLTSLKGLKVSPFNESENQKGVKVKPLIDRSHFVEKNKGIKVNPSMKAKKEVIKEQGKEEIGLSGTFLENIDGKFEERNKEKADDALMRNESRNVKENIPEKQESESKSVISRQNLIVEQSKDKELLDLFKIALTPVEAEKVSVGYLIKDDILMRKWSPTACDNNEKGETVYQIAVPTVHRREVLELAHDLPVSGHLGVRKTYNRVLQHFFWPGLKRDVAKWCKECHTCQLGGKPNQNIPQAPLHPIPAFDEPFSHIIIDCVGPLPKTKSQNEYLLTIMCSSTRFPEAIPLRSIKTNTILKALIKFFTLFGLPKSIQSDQGTNFMAHAFQQVMNQLGIKQYKSSAYHPESQGALERFHQTLKTMIRMYCTENSRDWDEGVHLLLFAVRESVQESLGFSPFELVFGHAVRGPLLLLKEKWLDEDPEKISVLKYVATFKDRLFRAGQMAKRNLQESQSKMKVWYDRKAKSRCFEPGDRVLVLFPVVGNPLKLRSR